MKSNFFPKLILMFVFSMFVFSCTSDDIDVTAKKDTVLMKTGDTLADGQPRVPNPK